MFETLEQTGLARWVGESLWGYPILLSMHIVGLAVVVGIFVVRDLRILGLFEGIPGDALAALTKLGWTGFLINALSGVALFSSQATVFIQSTPFLTKIGSIFCAAVCGVVLQRRAALGGAALSGMAKAVAALSLLFWVSAIVAGRLIAYL